MGRPRKRPRNIETKDSNLEPRPVVPEFNQLPYLYGSFQSDPFANVGSLPSPNETVIYGSTHSEQASATCLSTVDSQADFYFGNELNAQINSGVDDTSGEEAAIAIEPTVQEPIQSQILFEGGHPAPSPPGPACSCLAAIYLAMSSLQEFPTDVESALATVRTAANTAQAAIRCTKCGHFAPVLVAPPIEVFQNTMLLGTILPIIVNGYKRLLDMVDEETEKAKVAGFMKIFQISTYGGLCGQDTSHMTTQHLGEVVMEPTEWRATVRGLLRADIYGVEGCSTGLKGIISEMEQRQLYHHRDLHQLVENVSAHKTGKGKCSDGKDRLCLRMLETAKTALSALVIA